MKDDAKNPNVAKLVKIIEDILQKKGDDSKFIVFVKTRATAITLSRFLNKCKQTVKCTYLIGHGGTDEHGEYFIVVVLVLYVLNMYVFLYKLKKGRGIRFVCM